MFFFPTWSLQWGEVKRVGTRENRRQWGGGGEGRGFTGGKRRKREEGVLHGWQ